MEISRKKLTVLAFIVVLVLVAIPILGPYGIFKSCDRAGAKKEAIDDNLKSLAFRAALSYQKNKQFPETLSAIDSEFSGNDLGDKYGLISKGDDLLVFNASSAYARVIFINAKQLKDENLNWAFFYKMQVKEMPVSELKK